MLKGFKVEKYNCGDEMKDNTLKQAYTNTADAPF